MYDERHELDFLWCHSEIYTQILNHKYCTPETNKKLSVIYTSILRKLYILKFIVFYRLRSIH